MTFTEYQADATRTMNHQSVKRGQLTIEGVMGLCGEAGECIDLVKKATFQGHPLDRDKLIDELGDVLWYLSATAYSIGCPLDVIAEHNIVKLRGRYPKGFRKEDSMHREEVPTNE